MRGAVIIIGTSSREHLRLAMRFADALLSEQKREQETQFLIQASKPISPVFEVKSKKSIKDPTHPRNAFRKK